MSGYRAYTKEESRVFRADQFLQFWHADIADLWRDKIDFARPLHFNWVTPAPKALATRERIGHLILQQDPDPTLVPTVITIDMLGHQRSAFGLAAALLGNPIEFFQVRDLLQLARLCLDQRCGMKLSDRVWAPGVPQQVQPGAGLQFIVMPPILLSHLGDDHVVHAAIPTATVPQEEPVAPAHPPLEAHSEFVPALYASWLTLATTGPAGLEYVLRIQTWYLESGFVRHHDECRDVVLGEDFWTWETTIIRRWADFIVPDIDVDFHLALPAPPTAATPNEIHSILAQNLREFECSSLVTTYDNAVLRGAPYTAAMILPSAALKAEIVRAIGKTAVCPPHEPTATCTCWHGGNQIFDGRRYPNRNGFSFLLIIHRHLPPNFWYDGYDGWDGLSLLQTHASLHSDNGRRPTTGQVFIPSGLPKQSMTSTRPSTFTHPSLLLSCLTRIFPARPGT